MAPRDGDRFVEQAGGEDDGEVRAAMEAHGDLAFGNGDMGGHVDGLVLALPGGRRLGEEAAAIR